MDHMRGEDSLRGPVLEELTVKGGLSTGHWCRGIRTHSAMSPGHQVSGSDITAWSHLRVVNLGAEGMNWAFLCSRTACTSLWGQFSKPGYLSAGPAIACNSTGGPHNTGLASRLHKSHAGCCSRGSLQSLLPLLGTFTLLLAQCLLLTFQVFPQLFCLAQVALCSLLVALLQLGLVQAPEPPHLLLVFGD